MSISLFLYGAIVLALLIAELREDVRAQYVFKPLAAFGFILIALQVGALETPYGQLILAGLMVCAVGDVLLLSRKSEKLFIGGMAAFALAHLGYMTAFVTHPADVKNWLLLVPVIFGLLVVIGVYRWIRPNLDKSMKLAVALYIAIIYLMVFFAMKSDMDNYKFLAPIPAIMFAISDSFVARDRFVKPSPKNALAITPLYFGAQALLP